MNARNVRQVSFEEAVEIVRFGLQVQGLSYARMLTANLQNNCGFDSEGLLAEAAGGKSRSPA